VIVGSRNFERGETAAMTVGADAHALQLDVTNQASIAAAAARIRNEFGRLDVLVNNTGISHAGKPGRSLEEIVKSGRASVTSLAHRSTALVISKYSPGSLTLNSDSKNARRSMFGTYSLSKTALNALTVAFASELESEWIKVNAACPSFTSTYLNNFEGKRTVQQAAREPVRLALLDVDGPTGTFSNEEGRLPW
jgi:NAD(P)-dependent dehydrogenase (short-subunit alcohol dehydrogenase family)